MQPSAQVVCLALRHAILPKQYPAAYELQHQLAAKRYRERLRQRFEDWREVAALNPAA